MIETIDTSNSMLAIDVSLRFINRELNRRWEEIRRLCNNCKTTQQSGTLNGYTCPEHYKFFTGHEMATLGE